MTLTIHIVLPVLKIGNGKDVVTSLPFAGGGGAADIGNATILKSGLMSAEDKRKLNNIEENATSVYVDSTLNNNSSNAIQNKAVYNALEGKANTEHTHDSEDIEGLSTVATSGSFNDLSDTENLVLKESLKNVAFSGDFNDLSNTEGLATKSEVNNKQDILTGTEGQVVQFDNEGKPAAVTLELISVNDIDTICGVNN